MDIPLALSYPDPLESEGRQARQDGFGTAVQQSCDEPLAPGRGTPMVEDNPGERALPWTLGADLISGC